MKQLRVVLGEDELTALMCGQELIFPTDPELHLILSDIGFAAMEFCYKRAVVETLVPAEERERLYFVPRKQ